MEVQDENAAEEGMQVDHSLRNGRAERASKKRVCQQGMAKGALGSFTSAGDRAGSEGASMMPDYQASLEAEEDYIPWDFDEPYLLDLDLSEGEEE